MHELQTVLHPRTGKPTQIFKSTNAKEAYERGQQDAIQDSCENCPFASVGGLDARPDIEAPFYIVSGVEKDYLRGYTSVYGDDWATVRFTWRAALTL